MTAVPYTGLSEPAFDSPPRRPRPTPVTDGWEWHTASRANWLWLVPMPSWNHAVEIAPPRSRLPGALDHHFARVDRITLDPSARLPFDDESVDCVALHDAGDAVSTPDGAALFAECHRVLAPGGWLYVAVANDESLARRPGSRLAWCARVARDFVLRRSSGRTLLRTLNDALSASGFSHTRLYFAAPSEASQRILIPAERSAIIAQERLDRALSKNGPLRGVLAAAGLHDVLYPVRVFLCRR